MLVLTRKVGSVIYGGTRLGNDVEATYDHKFTTDKIVDTMKERYALIRVDYRSGSSEVIRLDAANEDFLLGDVRVALIAINAVFGNHADSGLIARIGIDAPKSYRIVRDNANKKFA